MTNQNYTIVGDDGMPIASVDMDQLSAVAVHYMYQLATACEDIDELDRLAEATLIKVGPEAFGYVAAMASKMMAEFVVAPMLEVGDAAGVDLRPGLIDARDNAAALADGGDPR